MLREQLIEDIQFRLLEEVESFHNPLMAIKKKRVDEYFDRVMGVIYMHTRKKKGLKIRPNLMSEIICAVGDAVIKHYKLKRDTALSAKIGAFILYSFEKAWILRVVLSNGGKKHQQYIVQNVNEEALTKLWMGIRSVNSEKLPSHTPYEEWSHSTHATGVPLIKTQSKMVLAKITPHDNPMVYDLVNSKQKVGWVINEELLVVARECMQLKNDAFDSIWSISSKEAQASKLRETLTVLDVAKRFKDKPFYHLYTLDFRGRCYCNTAYLNEQGADLAKGLLRRHEEKPIGEKGLYWLYVSLATNWAGDSGMFDGAKTDKIPLDSRYLWTDQNKDTLLLYAEDPLKHTGWMQADAPWQFLSACLELRKLMQWHSIHGDYEMPSGIEAFIDGTTNGSQHLAALTRDEYTAPFVNLTKTMLPGDLYRLVADFTWTTLKEMVDNYSKDDVIRLNQLIDKIIYLKKEIRDCQSRGDDTKADAFRVELEVCRTENKDSIAIAYPLYFYRITDAKQKRKIVKRNTMTLPYGGSAYGMGSQQKEDARKHGIELLTYMEPVWAYSMGRLVFSECKRYMKLPMQLLALFEKAGEKAEEEGRFLSWTVPVTNFLAVQHYVEGKVIKKRIQYGPPYGERMSTGYFANTYQMLLAHKEIPIMSKGRQAQGAAPNIIHSLDAAHLMMTAASCPFTITTIHDSFGTHLCDMTELYHKTRIAFVELYKNNPLFGICDEIGADVESIDIGSFNIQEVLTSEFIFS
jgi:DNA-directed RNA polymerase